VYEDRSAYPQLQSDSDETPASKKLWGWPSLTFSHPWEAEMNGKSPFPQHKRSTSILCMRLPRTKDNAANIAWGALVQCSSCKEWYHQFCCNIHVDELFLTLQSTSIFVVYVKYTMLASRLHTYLLLTTLFCQSLSLCLCCTWTFFVWMVLCVGIHTKLQAHFWKWDCQSDLLALASD